MKFSLVALAALLPLGAIAASSEISELERSVAEAVRSAYYEENIDRRGDDYTSWILPRPLWDLCRSICKRDDRCDAWTYVKPGVQGPEARCWLKKGPGTPTPSDCCVSGTM